MPVKGLVLIDGNEMGTFRTIEGEKVEISLNGDRWELIPVLVWAAENGTTLDLLATPEV